MEGAQTDQLGQFLSSCLKQTKHASEARAKLDEEGIDYDILFELGEEDLRSTLLDLDIKKYQVGLIVNKLRKIQGSGVSLYPLSATTSTFVVLTTEQNNYILGLSKNKEATKQNTAKLQQAMEAVHTNAKRAEVKINEYYETISQILTQQQSEMLTKLETLKNSKLSILKKESIKVKQSLQVLEKSSADFKKIINDKKLDITEKQITITQHIESSQHALLNYKLYFQNDMSLPTQPRMEYEADLQSFKTFTQKMDNILDSDVVFNEIKFKQTQAIISWKSDLFKLQKNAKVKFQLQFKPYLLSTADGAEKWKVLRSLQPTQTEINLYEANGDDYEDKVDEKDDYKHAEPVTDVSIKGRAGLLIGSTKYDFRICVAALNINKIYSNVLTIQTPKFKRMQSSILNINEEIQLMEWIPHSSRCSFELLFRGSRDGFAASTFHQKCDDQGKTLVIVESAKKNIFGGYTEKSWKYSGDYTADPKAWIYLLKSARGDKPEKWTPTKYPQYSIYAHTSYGPTFGGHDIYLADSCNSNTSSYSNLGHSYSANPDRNKLAGSYNFKVTDYEVWKIS